jgi:uncharacterized protein (DUF2236 family)
MLLTAGTQIVPLKRCYELLHGRMSASELEQYWDESKRFCSLFGIDPDVVPESWGDFDRYWHDALTGGELEMPRDGATDRYGPILDQSGMPRLSRLVARWFVSLVFNTMDESARAMFEPTIPLARKRRVITAVSCLSLRVAYRCTPAAMKLAPRARAAYARSGRPLPQSRLASRLATRLPHPIGTRMPSLTTPESAEVDPANSPAFNRCPI